MRYPIRTIAVVPGVFIVIGTFILLTGCRNPEERRASVMDTIDTLSETASGAFSTARSGVKGAVDAGTVAVETAKDTAEDISDRAGKIRRGTELIREGLKGEENQ